MKIGGYSPGSMGIYGGESGGKRKIPYNDPARNRAENMAKEDVRLKRRMLSDGQGMETTDTNGKRVFQAASEQNAVNSMRAYTETLQASRKKAKESSLQVKHVRYQAKAISSQIVKSKTSTNCRQVVGKARREVIRLKRLRSDENYDAEELQAAITHAQSMERVAKKKLNHLLQEEMIHVKENENGSVEGQDIEETLGRDGTVLAKDEIPDENAGDKEGFEEVTELERLQGALEEMPEDPMEDAMNDLEAALQEMLEETGLADLTESLAGPPKMEMEEREFKDYQRKHRLAEMKELIKADGEYLKARFEQLQRAAANASGVISPGSAATMGSGVTVSADAGMTCGGSIDFSI